MTISKNDYVNLKEVKEFLDIDNNEDDLELTNLIADANQEIDIRLNPYADKLPLQGDFLEHARKAGIFYVVSCVRDKSNNHEAGSRFMKKFDDKIKSLILALKAQPTARTKRVHARTQFDDEVDMLPSQNQFF